MASSELNPGQKAAAVIIALGADKASQIYRYLDENDLEMLTVEVARMKNLTSDQTESALDDFYRLCLTQKFITDGGMGYAKQVLEKAFGAQAANSLLERVTKSLKVRAFEFLRKMDSKNLFAIIQHERPQTIALILAYARSDQAADIIAELPKKKGVKVVEAIARMDRTSPNTIRIVEDLLRRRMETILSVDFAQIGGIDYIADVINNMDRGTEKFLFDELSRRDEILADEIRKKMFVFEDITILDGMSIQKFLREVDSHDLVYALKGANKEVSDVIFANMSTRMAESVRSDLEFTYNVRVRDVEEAQQKIVAVIRRLEEAGELEINKGGKDEIIA